MKQCFKCKKDKEDNDFSKSTRKSGKTYLNSWCKSCSSVAASARNRTKRKNDPELWKQKDKERWKKKRLTENPKRKRINDEKKQKYVDYKGGKCQLCGYDKCNAALDFHHINPIEKDFMITVSSRPWETIKAELDKCVLLCANCHRELHFNYLLLSTI